MCVIVYSRDGERFEEFDAVMDSLRDDYEPGTEVDIEQGCAELATHADFVNAGRLIEELQDRAWDDHGDWAEDYLIDLSTEKTKELKKLIVDWLDENAKKPTFFRVNDINKITVIVDE